MSDPPPPNGEGPRKAEQRKDPADGQFKSKWAFQQAYKDEWLSRLHQLTKGSARTERSGLGAAEGEEVTWDRGVAGAWQAWEKKAKSAYQLPAQLAPANVRPVPPSKAAAAVAAAPSSASNVGCAAADGDESDAEC
eukprot:gene20322-48753_t